MAYQVLARKWRPRGFDTMVGQEHVLRALVNALDNERLHHAYLFTGTRGVGKTTVARIFAKCLNCETGVTSKPCGECDSCREIDGGRFVDLIEVDAASRTGVDETRELLENVQYTPTRGRYKVYLIDEVHMFSNHSFNALLKTLEEPPPHVKFLLATTDPQKLPVTILSRCLQFNLKRLSAECIRGHLAQVLEQEQIDFEPGALALLARGADGSMRDGLSLLDQAIAFGGGRVADDDVRAMLGTIADDHVYGVLEDLAEGDARGLLARVADLAARGPDFAAWLADLLTLLQRIALVQQVEDSVDDALGDPQRVRDLAGRLQPEDVQLFYQIGLIGRRDLPLAPEPRGGFEMVLLRMLAFRPDDGGRGTPPAPGGQGVANARPQTPRTPVPPASDPAAQPAAQQAAPPSLRQAAAPSADSSTALQPTAAVSALDEARAMLAGQPQAGKADPAPIGNDAPPTGASPAETAPIEAPPIEAPPGEPSPPLDAYHELAGDPAPDMTAAPEPEPELEQAPEQAPGPSESTTIPDWLTLMPQLGLDGWVQELASHCVQVAADDSVLSLAVDRTASHLLNGEREKRIRDAVQGFLGVRLDVLFEEADNPGVSPAMVREQQRQEALRNAQRSIADDVVVQSLQERFGASVQADSVRPV